ncbi:MAG: nucleotide-binding protein [Hyphomonadaceae bacterium]
MTICDRFAGENGRRLLREAWLAQPFVSEEAVAAALADASEVLAFEPGTAIVSQYGDDADFYLILVGTVEIEANGRGGRFRHAGTHFGELTLVDVNARRSATVRAKDQVCVARISESAFSEVARDNSNLWRCLAVEIARRFRQRLEDIPPRNAKPFVFIGSSREALPIAEALAAGLSDEYTDVRVWTHEDIFGPSDTAIESLEDVVRGADFGILVFSPDDRLRSRGRTHLAPRDNVVFELGLCMGGLGRGRSFVVMPRSGVPTLREDFFGVMLSNLGVHAPELRVPSDLAGLTPLTYAKGDLTASLAPVCERLRKIIRKIEAK